MRTEIVEKTSKNGTKYCALDIYLTPSCKKTVFLDNAELELIRLYYSNKQNTVQDGINEIEEI